MRYLFFIFTLVLLIPNTQAQRLQNLANGLDIESIDLITANQMQYLKISFLGSEESFFERSFPYPQIKVMLNDGTTLGTKLTYSLLKTVLIPTKLQSLPKDFSCKIHLNTLHNTEPDLIFSYTANVAANYQFEITNIELVYKQEEPFLQVSIKDRNPQHQIYSYPIFRIESNNQIVAQREMSSYSLLTTELIPTTLTTLPENFECTIYLDSFGDMGDLSYQLHYKKATQ